MTDPATDHAVTRDRRRSRTSRRLRFRSRSVAASVALTVPALAAVYAAVESTLALLDLPALVSAPFALVELARENTAVAIAIGAGLAALGLVCLVVALTPGRYRRRTIADERAAFVVDDDVVASGISRAVARRLDIDRSQVRTSLGRRRADVRVTPTTGFGQSAERARTAAAEVVEAIAVRPAPSARATVERSGVIG